MEIKCPKCGSLRVDQYRMPTGAIWCNECGFKAKHKEIRNPFVKKSPKSHNSNNNPEE